MPDDEHLIETDVVRIVPDATGFRRKLDAQLKKEMTPAPKAVVELAVEGAGLRNKVREAVAAQQALRGQPTYKVALVADRTGFAASVRKELAKVRQVEYKVKLVADGSGLRGARGGGDDRAKRDVERAERQAEREAAKAEREANKIYKRLREVWEVVEQDELRAYAHLFTRFRNHTERMQAAEIEAHREEAKRNKEAADRENALATAAEREQTQRAQRRFQRVRTTEEMVQHAHGQAEREMTAVTERENTKRAAAMRKTRNAFQTYRKGPPIINYGGAGIRPMNALIGAAVALSPALFAVGANALQASTALTALGSAGIGAALGVGGLVVAFRGLGDVLKLRQTVKNEALTLGANSAKGAADLAAKTERVSDALGEYRTALREENQASAAVHQARVEAARDLENLRQKVVDLNNEYRSNQLSVREAEEAERATNRNFFSTATQRMRAHQDTMDARARLGDTRLERRQAQQDLRESIKKGVAHADKVISAQDAYTDAKRRRQRAGHALQNARSGADVAAIGKTTSAAAQLEQKLKDMAPAARDIYYWFDHNEQKLKAIQREIAQRVLPGFGQFLKEVDSRPAGGGKTTIQLFADAMGQLGGLAGKYTGLLGAFSNSPLFRSSFAKVQRNNAKGFDILGAAALKSLKPFTRILAAASPLFPKMAQGLSNLIDRFDAFITRADKDGSLGKWFDDAYESGRKWMSIGGNLLRLLKNLFTLSLPTGASLVDKLVELTDSLADWSESSTGQRQLREFFEFFKNLPYEKIKDFVIQAAQMFAAFRTAQWIKANPFFAAIGLIAKSHPDLAIQLMSGIVKMATTVAQLIAEHPEMTAFLLAAYSGNKARKALGLTMSIPGLSKIKDLLTSKFKILDKVFGGGATTGTMTVHAGVVNVYGKALGGAPGTTAAGGKRLTNAGAVTGGVTLAAVLASIFGKQGYDRAVQGKGILSPLIDFARNPNPETAVNTLQLGSPFGYAGYAAGNPEVRKLIGALNAVTMAVNPLASVINRLANKGKEDYQFARLQSDIREYGKTRHAANDPGVANRDAVKEYIDARKKAVDAAVENAGATRGEAAAEQVRETETRRSVDTLKLMLQQYGWNADKAGAYADAIYDLNSINEKQRLSNLAAKDAMEQMRVKLGQAGTKASTTTAEMEILRSKLDELDGTRTITVTINGQAVVFKNLETALIYQRLLETGQPATQGNINKQRAAFDKQSLRFADGGPVRGSSPHPRADNIPALLTANEYVQPVDVVKHYGVGFMDALRRKEVPRYAKGGRVWPFKVGWPAGMADAVSPYLTGGSPVGSEQVAELAEATARRMGATQKQLVALIEAGIVESTMRNINYGDRDSVGFLQQRPSQGWGTVKQLLNPAYATRKFIQAARRVNDRGMSAGQLAQAVQRSAYPYRYGQHEADAVAILNRNAPFLTGYTGGGRGTQAGLIGFGRWLQARGYDVTENPAFGGVHGGHTDNSQHYRGNAIDVNHGAGTSKREQAYLARIIPEAHRRGFRTIFMTGRHYSHAHVDLGPGHAQGGLVRKYDTGGTLPPGFTLAYNGTGQHETVRTAKQEQALTGPIRLHRQDVALLAAALAGQNITMDGRKVAETTNRFNYVPAGV